MIQYMPANNFIVEFVKGEYLSEKGNKFKIGAGSFHAQN